MMRVLKLIAIHLFVVVCATFLTTDAAAQTTPFNFFGNGGVGLLPGNEVGANTATAATSSASGGVVGGGIVFDATSNVLDYAFEFSGISGLFNAASGIHLHLPATAGDPFNSTGPIVFNLNSGSDPAVTYDTPLIAIGATSGMVGGSISFANDLDLVDDLFAGELYLNIHSSQFTGGELRGTLVAIPEPSSMALLFTSGSLFLAGFARRTTR